MSMPSNLGVMIPGGSVDLPIIEGVNALYFASDGLSIKDL